LLGLAPNDAAVPGDEKGTNDPMLQALQAIQAQQQERQSYSIQQFVEPEETQGIPSDFISPYASPLPTPQ
jgi:hypothetical protein